MCIGLPMRVVATGPSWADVEGRGERRRVRTALVGTVDVDEWVLVHLDSAVQRLEVARAVEINAVLDLLQAVSGGATPPFALDFDLPSKQSADDLARLTS